MYGLNCLFLVVFVYLLPILSLFPRLIASPRFAISLPILNAFLIYWVTGILQTLGCFTDSTVLFLVLGLGVIAACRIHTALRTLDFSAWIRFDWFLPLFNALVLLPFMVKLGTHGFERGDEIYSWNFWAIQHYFSETIDFLSTKAAYPQLFPKFLAFGYHLLGDIDLQLPLKAMLILFPFSMLNSLASHITGKDPLKRLLYCFLVLFGVLGIGLSRYFSDAYADPLMTAALVVSCSLYCHARKDALSVQATKASASIQKQQEIGSTLGAMVCCGLVAMLTKQPGLFWSLISVPLLLLGFRRAVSFKLLGVLILISIGFSLAWIFGEGREFYANGGVIQASFQGRTWIEQLFFAMNKYFVQKPSLLALFILVLWSARRYPLIRPVFIFFLLPSLLLWLLFGAYHLRLGQHIVALSMLLVCVTNFETVNFKRPVFQKIKDRLECAHQKIAWSLVVLSVLISFDLFWRVAWIERSGVSLLAGGRQSLTRYFGKDADKIYQTLYLNSELILWVPSSYLYGMFYHHTQLITPGYLEYQPYDQKALVQELKTKQPDYVFIVDPAVQDGPASLLLKDLFEACPQVFEKFAEGPNRFNYITLKVKKAKLKSNACLAKFGKVS